MKFKLIIPILILLNILVFGFNFASVYCLAQGKPTVKVDVPATTSSEIEKPRRRTKKEINIKINDTKEKLVKEKKQNVRLIIHLTERTLFKDKAEKESFQEQAKKLQSFLSVEKDDDFYISSTSGDIFAVLNADQLERLKLQSDVIFEINTDEIPDQSKLNDSIPQISDILIQSKQFGGGEGQYIAVLDSGIKSDHPDFEGRVVYEACYASSNQCPNGQNEYVGTSSSTITGAALPCGITCDHGTHVAGIMGGKNGTARKSNILAFQVFSAIGSFPSDQRKALDKINFLQTDINSPFRGKIAAVNMSLGSVTP